jgi:ATP-dependent Lon protease
MPGSGHLSVTGQLGDVMKESAEAAVSYVRAHSVELGLPDDYFAKHDLHIHVPAGAIPKDGPSAGVTMATAVASLVTDTPVSADVAMTGEITLTGQVLPIGGLKEKTLAAQRAGITTVILPSRNEADLEDVPEELRKGMTFVPVERIEQVWKTAMGLSFNGRRERKPRVVAPVPAAKPAAKPSAKPGARAEAAASPRQGGRSPRARRRSRS